MRSRHGTEILNRIYAERILIHKERRKAAAKHMAAAPRDRHKTKAQRQAEAAEIAAYLERNPNG